MNSCSLFRSCRITSHIDLDGARIAVGMYEKSGDTFAVICVRDPWLGCQHITTKRDGLREIIRKSRAVIKAHEILTGCRFSDD